MKILVFTDVPPTHALTAGLVLDRLARFLPPGAMVVFAPMNKAVQAPRPGGLGWMPAYYTLKPDERGSARFAKAPWLRNLWAATVETWRREVEGRGILHKAIAFGREHEVDAVLGVLQGQTVINLAEPLAKALKVPLYTLVWDPFSWWVKGHGVDPYTAKLTQKAFDSAVRNSVACATASWAMSEAYSKDYGVRAVQVIASHDASLAKTPPGRLHDPNRVVLGMAGQFYASEEWRQMMIALDCAGWEIAGRPVHIRTMGGQPPPKSKIPKDRLTYLGWMSQPEMVAALSECDILYCPYPFEAEMDEVSRVSFPSKLVAYFAAGRPAVFQGPADSSPARYCQERGSAVVVTQPYASAIFNGLHALVTDQDLFKRTAEAGQRAFAADFTLKRMRETFYEFLGQADEGQVFDTSAAPRTPVIDDRSAPPFGERLSGAAWSAIAWIPPLPTLTRRIEALEAQVESLSFEAELKTAELRGFYGFTARKVHELHAAEETIEIARAELEKKMAVQKPVFAKLG